MEKKATVRDVAREAGVSVATVSYIMNGRTDQKISPETKKKVLQIANLLNYKPSHAAKSLVTGRNNIVGIAYKLQADTPSRNISMSYFIELLVERMNRMHYDVLMLPISDNNLDLVNRNVDAIIAIDLEDKLFRSLADIIMVPVIGVDMLINDNLFYQVYDDYPAIISNARENSAACTFILDEFLNEEFCKFVANGDSNLKVLYYSKTDIKEFSNVKGKVIILGNILYLMLYPLLKDCDITVISFKNENIPLPSKPKHLYLDLEKKANYTMNILLNALDRNFDLEHDVKISPDMIK